MRITLITRITPTMRITPIMRRLAPLVALAALLATMTAACSKPATRRHEAPAPETRPVETPAAEATPVETPAPEAEAPEAPAAPASEWVLGLPVRGSRDEPLLVLDVGERPALLPGECPGAAVASGVVASHEGDDYVSPGPDGVTAARKGFGSWSVAFRFAPDPPPVPGRYRLWARWKQGGDPKVCAQTFTVLAGPAPERVEERGSFELRNATPWQDQWVGAGGAVTVKPGDRIVEIRDSGSADSAKVFDAFLLSPYVYGLPGGFAATGAPAGPLLALELGTPDDDLPMPKGGSVRVAWGKAVASEGADYVSAGRDEVTAAHKDFGAWGVTFRFALKGMEPGFYGFHVRYKGGGEPSQTAQTYTVKAGPDEQALGVRGAFVTRPRSPWAYEWLAAEGGAEGGVVLLHGDRVLEIVNEGKADGAKVFDVFVLEMTRPAPAWMSEAQGRLRGVFLAASRRVAGAGRRLLVVDGPGAGDRALFGGLADDRARALLEGVVIIYLLGAEADAMAEWLNLPARPAAAVVGEDVVVLGVLAGAKEPGEAARFLADPGRVGRIPRYAEAPAPEPVKIERGVPAKWLVATGWAGRAGVGVLGLDAEAAQRPNPGEEFGYNYFLSPRRSRWEERPVGPRGECSIVAKLEDSYAWSRGTSYAVLYLEAARPTETVLHLAHSGVESAAYLDGERLTLSADAAPPFSFPRRAGAGARVEERRDREIHLDRIVPQEAQGPLAARLDLGEGWHCIVLKLVHAQGAGEGVFFAARFARPDGRPAEGLVARTSDPTAALATARAAERFWPVVRLEGVPADLPRPGEPLALVVDMKRTPARGRPEGGAPFLPFEAALSVRMTDFEGAEVGTFETRATFPATVRLDLGRAPEAGYYALHLSLHRPDGRLIRRFPADGFSVVRGAAAQRERLDAKELWSSYYYALEDWESLASWLERTGVFKNLGSTPGGGDEAKWEDARRRGIVLAGDFAGDSTWMNSSERDARRVVDLAARHTRYFKSVNEIDGRCEPEWIAARAPAKWVERARWQHEAVHAARADALHCGGSLYCSGVERPCPEGVLSPRAWFRACLELGLERYVDAWDVHAYPKLAPVLEGPLSDSPHASELGVLDVFRELGRANTKPFWLGETGALPWQGFDGLRWQAAAAAKLVAWANSREDFRMVAFCAAHHYRRLTNEDYAMAHQPGEAALYTAGALVDGLPYRRFRTDAAAVQAAHFGETFIIWRTDDAAGDWRMRLEGPGPWTIVDVVGRARPLEARGGEARFRIGPSPVYVLRRAEYERLTRAE